MEFLIIGGFLVALIALIILGMPIFAAFLTVSLVASILTLGLFLGPRQIALSTPPVLQGFGMVAIPLFILLGELLYHSGLASRALDAVGKLIGRVPGRLALVATGGGAVFGMLSGSQVASTTMLGSTIVPEMRKHGYSKAMSAGPVLGAAPLAMMFPPSAMAVVAGTIGGIPIGPLLIAGIVPGILLVLGNSAYIIGRSIARPHESPHYAFELPPVVHRIGIAMRDIVPLMLVFVALLVFIIAGWATPTEAAAVGTLVAFMLVLAYRALTWEGLKKALVGTIQITSAIFIIIAAATGYSMMLAFTGATQKVLGGIDALGWPPILIVILLLVILLFLGLVIEQVSIMLITLPIFVPIVMELGFNPVWFGVLAMLTMDIAGLTPPVGLTLFILKGVIPKDFSLNDVIRSALPYIVIDLIVMGVILAFPALITVLPNLML